MNQTQEHFDILTLNEQLTAIVRENPSGNSCIFLLFTILPS